MSDDEAWGQVRAWPRCPSALQASACVPDTLEPPCRILLRGLL